MLRHLMILAVAAVVMTSGACAREESREGPAAGPAPGPAPAEATAGEDVEATITQLEREWVAAIVNKDQAALSRLLADDFAGTSPTAHVYTKEMAIADLSNGTYVVEAMDLDEISVNVYGDTAVAFASQNEKSRYGATDISGHYHYTNVWVKRSDRWQAVASHGTRYQTGH
jgi:ketosteroid isomerase-like protein